MDPITAAIVAVLPELASDVVECGVKDAYEGLKAAIRRKWSETAPISKAIAAVEKAPKSERPVHDLEEKVAAVKATQDPEVLEALRVLGERMKARGIGDDAVSNIQVTVNGGSLKGIIGAGTVTVNTMNFGKE